MRWFTTTEEDTYNKVPIGLEEFNQWSGDVIAMTRLPLNDSMRFAVASIVLESKDILSKKEAAKKLVKAAQNQLAAFVFQDIKSKRMAADAAAAEQLKEAPHPTTPTEVLSGQDALQEVAERVVQEA